MFASKYYKYISVASVCAGLGAGLNYCYGQDVLSTFTSHLTAEKAFVTALAQSKQSYDKHSRESDYIAAINYSRWELSKKREISGTPGVSIAVNVDGTTVWSEGLGLADVENDVPCTSQTVMRIASISKSITMAVLARLWQEGQVDLDKPVQEYVPKFPLLSYNGEEVTITTRMLVSHLSGIRHYTKKESGKEDKNKENCTDNEKKNQGKTSEKHGKTTDGTTGKNSLGPDKEKKDTATYEMYMTVRYNSVEDALNIFKNDELLHKPGSKYLYTTYGYTLVSAVIESVTNSKFPKIMKEFFSQMGLHNTSLDYNENIVYHRARFYSRSRKSGSLKNAAIVDNSYKWAGGGFLSNVHDLARFGDMMLYCFQQRQGDLPGYLSNKTVEELWSVKTAVPRSLRGSGYGMGWFVVPNRQEFGWGDKQPMVASHTGGAVGASSVLLVLPSTVAAEDGPPRGITVAILGNLDNVDWEDTAAQIAKRFERVGES